MIVLQQLTNTVCFSPRIALPYPTTGDRVGDIQIQLKSRTTNNTKTFIASTVDFSDDPRAVTVTFHLNQYPENLNAGFIRLESPDFPAGYYSYLVYNVDENNFNPVLIDVGVAFVERGSAEEGGVEYVSEDTSPIFKSFEK